MYKVPKYNPEVYLIHRGGQRWVFKSLKEATEKIYQWNIVCRWTSDRSHVGNHFTDVRNSRYDYKTHEYHCEYCDYIVRDDLGAIITVDDIRECYTDIHTKSRAKFADKQREIIDSQFRRAPVPHTGYKRTYGSTRRRVRVMSETIDNEFLKYDEDAVEYDIKPRPSRDIRFSYWDDRYRSDWDAKNWKKHRKHQWREKS